MPNKDSRSPQQQPMGPDGASQFVPRVHAVKVSTNGLVYVANRGGPARSDIHDRGKFVNQVFIGSECLLLKMLSAPDLRTHDAEMESRPMLVVPSGKLSRLRHHRYGSRETKGLRLKSEI